MRSSDGRTTVWPVSPWRRALREERCLPAWVRGPVEFWALARFVSARLVNGCSFVEVSNIVLPFCLWCTIRGLGVKKGYAAKLLKGWVRIKKFVCDSRRRVD